MSEVNVIVVPETEEYRVDVCEDLVAYISNSTFNTGGAMFKIIVGNI